MLRRPALASLGARTTLAWATGLWLGASAGLATALADFGAHWLYMESARDRSDLWLRLICLQPAAGAALGCLLGAWLALISPPILALARRLARKGDSAKAGGASGTRAGLRHAVIAGVCTLPLLPALGWIAEQLLSGGKTSRLAGRPALIVLAFVLLCALSWAWLAAASWFTSWAARQPRLRPQLLAALAAVASAGMLASKLNQHVLPNLYDYLHALLGAFTLACFGLALLAGFSWLAGSPGARAVRERRAAGLPLAAAASLGLVLLLAAAARTGLSILDRNQNVRVALMSSNMPHSRSLMLGLAPILPRVDRQSASLEQLRAAAARRRRAAAPSPGEQPSLPEAHVILISIDALRADRLGVAGYARAITPELDALAQSGVMFERAYAQAPHSSYSLCSLMTSEYLHETLGLGQQAPHDTLPRVLARAGYHSAAFYTQGIFHTAGEQLKVYHDDAFGFALHDHQDRPAEQMTDRVLAEIDRTLARNEPSSFFWVHYFDVHEPYEATTLGTSDADRYDSELLATDRAIGRLVREARARLQKPVVVAITADHGEEFHDHGGVYHGSTLYDEQVRVPLILVAPGLRASRVAAPVESIDIAPTLLGLLAIEPPASMRGRDLRALAGGDASLRGPVFSAVIHKKMVVSWPHKLIADLRFGLFELYDLERDPRERDNLADREPELLASLRGEAYAWLDSLATATAAGAPSPRERALEWGKLGDRRAVVPLSVLTLDEQASDAERSEAARLLGKLADPLAADSLIAATRSPRAWVAAEAAIALGRMFDPRAAPALRRLIAAEDPALRSRAGVSLGRLRDKAAVPALIDALWSAPDDYEREEAVRWLGRLGDPRALDPLINLVPEPHVRHLVVTALGELGDPRGFAPLLDVLTWERNTNVRDGVVRGLAALGDARALPVLWPLVASDPALRNTGEALVRLRALEAGLVGGSDLARPGAAPSGFGRCEKGPLRHDWDFLHRTYCTSASRDPSFRVRIPEAVATAERGSTVLLSIRRSDSVEPASLQLRVGSHQLPAAQVDGAWIELRWPLPANSLTAGELRAALHADAEARFDVDHLLIVPLPTPGT